MNIPLWIHTMYIIFFTLCLVALYPWLYEFSFGYFLHPRHIPRNSMTYIVTYGGHTAVVKCRPNIFLSCRFVQPLLLYRPQITAGVEWPCAGQFSPERTRGQLYSAFVLLSASPWRNEISKRVNESPRPPLLHTEDYSKNMISRCNTKSVKEGTFSR